MGKTSHPTTRPPRPTIPQTMAESIGRQILSGDFKPDTMISAGSLAEIYGVSRTCVLRTLDVLDSKGLTTTWARVGSRVNHWDKWHLLDPDLLRWAPPDSWLAAQAREVFDLLNWADLSQAGPVLAQLHRSLLPCVEVRP